MDPKSPSRVTVEASPLELAADSPLQVGMNYPREYIEKYDRKQLDACREWICHCKPMLVPHAEAPSCL